MSLAAGVTLQWCTPCSPFRPPYLACPIAGPDTWSTKVGALERTWASKLHGERPILPTRLALLRVMSATVWPRSTHAVVRSRDIMKLSGQQWAEHCDRSPRSLRKKEGRRLEPSEVAKLVVEAASDKKASDVVMIDIRERSVIADYFVICTGSSARQIQAIASGIAEKLDEAKIRTRGLEGSPETGWVLLDCGDVVVHVFGPMEREFYRLERLWSGAPTAAYLL
jgi:ribosome-associated protein